ncbi:MAG: hypothetical protein HC927_06235 [Deltaproteobacteria bacterium]|nr:hypothetical protein [Deltaproteobacteria bacterium]
MLSREAAASSILLALLACQPAPAGDEASETDDEIGDSESTDTSTSTTTESTDTTTTDSTDTTEESTETGEPETWRSALYPEDWTPGFTDEEGRFLHDFSYAGYHKGELELPDTVPGVTISVLDHGADPSGQSDSCPAIQATIDAVVQAGGGVVQLPAGSYRCDDLLTLSASDVVIRGEGPDATFLWFTRSANMSDRAHLRIGGTLSNGAEYPLTSDGQALSHSVWVADAGELEVGDEVALGWVITDEFIADHQMTGTWVSFNGQWRPFFRREVEAIECGMGGCEITLDVPLRYPALLRDQASLRVESGYIREVGVEDLAVSTVVEWEQAWANDRTHAIGLIAVADAWIRNVHSYESPNSSDDRERHLMSGGLLVRDAKRITIADAVMARAQNRGGGGNGYLFEISRSNEVLTVDSVGSEGRHNFIQNWDFGTSGCVWLRISTAGSLNVLDSSEALSFPAASEFHHSLALANLIDDSVIDDAWHAVNRNDYSSGAGHSATQNVLWNLRGEGTIRSFQFGWGYVIGTQGLTVRRLLREGVLFDSLDTEPVDWLEGEDLGDTLAPGSLYEDQLLRRLGG